MAHGMVAEWNKDQTELTVYASIQATVNMVADLSRFYSKTLKAGSIKDVARTCDRTR